MGFSRDRSPRAAGGARVKGSRYTRRTAGNDPGAYGKTSGGQHGDCPAAGDGNRMMHDHGKNTRGNDTRVRSRFQGISTAGKSKTVDIFTGNGIGKKHKIYIQNIKNTHV